MIILIHEAGHFWAAIKSGVKVEEFGLGLGPKVFKWTRGETDYTINAIPFGGFVKMLGEEDDGGDDPRSFAKAKLWKRMVITLAGVFMNFLSAWLLLVVLFSVGTNPFIVSLEDAKEGFKKGRIAFETDEISHITYDSEWGKLVLEGWETGEPAEEIKKMRAKKIQYPWYKSFGPAAYEIWHISKATVIRVGKLPAEILKNKTLPNDLGGPVRIAHVTYDLIPQGLMAILRLVVVISISLGVMNLLPIPALDGGRFLFQIVEFLLLPFKISLSPKIENYIHIAGFMLVMGLILAITWNDLLFVVGANGWFDSIGVWMVEHLRI